MSNQEAESAESQLVIPSRHPLRKGCLILLIAAIIACTAPLSLPKLTAFVNQIKWHNSGITNYSISVMPVGYASWPDIFGSSVVEGSQVVHGTTVDDLFRLAYECFVFCSVTYDPKYGYPTRISKGFIEGGWLEITVKPNTP